MKIFTWDNKKNEKLKKERGISFEDIIFYINKGYLLTIISNPSSKKYHGQKIFMININNYIHAVPFIETKTKIFLKTIFPSRKYTKLYLQEVKLR